MTESEKHNSKIQKLQDTSREEVMKRVLKGLILGYRNGDLSADDFRNYTNIPVERIDELEQEVAYLGGVNT